MYKIAASDLDGTLLSSDHKILPFTKKILIQLHAQGKEFVFATGRHHLDVAQMRDQLGIPAFMITSNGACIHNSQNDIIFQQHVPHEIIAGIIKMVKHDDEIIINLFRDNDWLVNKANTKTNFNHENFTYDFFDIDNPPLENIIKIFLTREDDNHDKLVIWEDKIKALFATTATIVFSSPSCLEIMDIDVSKGHALDAVAKLKGYQLKDCIAFGDGMNDFEMLSMAGKGLVMGSAHHKVKMALPNHEVIGVCDDQAVAHYLLKHLLDSTFQN
ncbi:MAG: Cof-type HAD-IIB family hydrolase [Psychromonas sp.]